MRVSPPMGAMLGNSNSIGSSRQQRQVGTAVTQLVAGGSPLFDKPPPSHKAGCPLGVVGWFGLCLALGGRERTIREAAGEARRGGWGAHWVPLPFGRGRLRGPAWATGPHW